MNIIISHQTGSKTPHYNIYKQFNQNWGTGVRDYLYCQTYTAM